MGVGLGVGQTASSMGRIEANPWALGAALVEVQGEQGEAGEEVVAGVVIPGGMAGVGPDVEQGQVMGLGFVVWSLMLVEAEEL